MQVSRLLRVLLALAISLVFLLLVAALLYLTEAAFEVWDRLSEAPGWFLAGYGTGFLALTGGAGWLVWRLLMPRRPPRPRAAPPRSAPAPDRQALERRLESAAQEGLDVSEARRELARLAERKEAGRIYVSLFGEISSGKSSLIRALVPDAVAEVGARGGTTRELREYRWTAPSSDELILVDVPGTNEADGELDALSRAEAQRAHLVLYICDGDLSRSQYAELEALLALGKPCVLALNKTDRYSQAEIEQLKARLRDRLQDRPCTEVVGVQAGGEREVLRVLADGSEELVLRPIPPQVEELRLAVQRHIDEDPELLERLRDSAVFSLVARRLEAAQEEHRRRRADELVDGYSRKAVLGAMAAVAPGSDLLIQGYLGVSLVRELSELYQVPVSKADRERLFSLVQREVGKTLTLVLAVAGNALKAFPGVGTLAGGVLHAVAYGLIFQSLGRALARSFESRGELHPVQAVQTFKETLGEDLETSARHFAKLALSHATDRRDRRAAGP